PNNARRQEKGLYDERGDDPGRHSRDPEELSPQDAPADLEGSAEGRPESRLLEPALDPCHGHVMRNRYGWEHSKTQDLQGMRSAGVAGSEDRQHQMREEEQEGNGNDAKGTGDRQRFAHLGAQPYHVTWS